MRVSLMNVSFSVPRIHSDHHDLGGDCAACCHDSHPGGESILIQSVCLTQIRDIKNIQNIWVEHLSNLTCLKVSQRDFSSSSCC